MGILKYISIYNILTHKTGTVKLILISKIYNLSAKIKFSSEYVYGPGISNKLLKQLLNFPGTGNYNKLNKLTDINELPDYYKFIMNKSGEIFTTPTGLIVYKYFYLFRPGFENCTEYMHNMVIADYLNLFSKRIKFILLIKKKYHLPRPVTYLIILALCELYFADIEKYACHKCGYYLNEIKLCEKCDYCNYCYNIRKENLFCINCGLNICSECWLGAKCKSCE